MPEEVISVKTESGEMPVRITRPRGDGPFKLVVLYMDAPGVRDDLHAAASRLAAKGYLVALPDLYYRLAPDRRPDPERLRTGDQEELARMAAAAQSVEDRVVTADTRAMVEQLNAQAPLDESGWGCVGFCMGGRFGLLAAAEFGDAIIAGSLLHPSRLVTDEPDSPHRKLDTVRAELFLGFGENDHVTPVDTIPPLREALERSRVAHRIEVFPDADHGFTMPGSRAYNPDAAGRAWEGTLELLTRRLAPA